jgi:hypothetical protein
MDQERDQIRKIDDARRRVAEDVRSVAENANVVERAKETAQSKMDDMKSTISERVREAREKLMDARDQMRRMSPADNPINMLIAGAAVGFLVGLALPVTRFESARLGPLGHDIKEKARQAGSEAVRRESEVIIETISAVGDDSSSEMTE